MSGPPDRAGTDASTSTVTTPAPRRLPQGELIALLAVLMATVAFSMDAMLPALPEIAAALTPQDVNRAQLILTSFMAGMGVGTLFAGPISDAIGRKRAMGIGFAIYLAAAAAALFANSLEWLLAARFVQGLGASGPRIVGTALVRDLYQGREMARITSIVMMIFILVPALAPSIGVLFSDAFGWHGVFGAFLVFGAAGAVNVHLNFLLGVLRVQQQELRHDGVRHLRLDGRAHKNNPVF